MNPLLPMVRESIERVIDSDVELTVQNVRADLERDVESYKLLLRSFDPERGLRALISSAIETALRDYPALPSGVHLDLEREHDPRKVQQLYEYRTEQIKDLERSRQDLANRLAQMSLEDDLERITTEQEARVE